LQKLLFLILINSIILIYFLLTKNFIKKGFNFCHISLYSLYIILSTDVIDSFFKFIFVFFSNIIIISSKFFLIIN
jgi:hypothetical protein